MTSRGIALLVGAMLLGMAGGARAAGDIDIVRDLAGRVGPVIGSAQACRDIARPRVQAIVDKFSMVIREASSNEAERSDLTQAFDRSVTDGRTAVLVGPDRLRPGRPPARRPRTLDRGTEPVQRHRPVLRSCGDGRASGDRADGQRPGRTAAARHRRKGNPLRYRGPLLRLRQGARTPDEARHRYRLQPDQRMPAASTAGC